MIKRVVNKHDRTRNNFMRAMRQDFDEFGVMDYSSLVMDTSNPTEPKVTIKDLTANIDGEIVSYPVFEYSATIKSGVTRYFLVMTYNRITNHQRNYPVFKFIAMDNPTLRYQSIETDDIGNTEVRTDQMVVLHKTHDNMPDPIRHKIDKMVPRLTNKLGIPGTDGVFTIVPPTYSKLDMWWYIKPTGGYRRPFNNMFTDYIAPIPFPDSSVLGGYFITPSSNTRIDDDGPQETGTRHINVVFP